MGLNDEAIVQEKSLTDLMDELAALENNAHNLADAPGAIRAKEREIIKAFGTAYDELKVLFEGANVEPMANAVKQQLTEQFAGEIANINEHIQSVVAQAKAQLDSAKVDIAAAVSEFQTHMTDIKANAATHATALNGLIDRVTAVEDHPALSIPPIAAPAPAEQPAGNDKPAEQPAGNDKPADASTQT